MNKIFLHFLINQTTQIYNIFISQIFFFQFYFLGLSHQPNDQTPPYHNHAENKDFLEEKLHTNNSKIKKKKQTNKFLPQFLFSRTFSSTKQHIKILRRKTPHEIKPRINPSMEQASLSSNPSFFRSHIVNPRKIGAFGSGTINPTDFGFKPHRKSEMTM